MVVIIDPYILSSSACSLYGPEPPPRSHKIIRGWRLGLFVMCMLSFVAYPSMLADASWKEVPKLEYQSLLTVLQHYILSNNGWFVFLLLKGHCIEFTRLEYYADVFPPNVQLLLARR